MRLATVGCRCAEVDGEDLHEHFEGEWPGTESSSQVREKETSSGIVFWTGAATFEHQIAGSISHGESYYPRCRWITRKYLTQMDHAGCPSPGSVSAGTTVSV